MPHLNPFNDKCVHGKSGVRLIKGKQVCECQSFDKSAEPEPDKGNVQLSLLHETDPLGFPRCVK